METLGIREFRERLAGVVGGRGRVVITVRGRPVRALVSVEEARLLEAMDDSGALQEALEAMKEE